MDWMLLRFSIVALIASTLSGCAYLTTYKRSVDLSGKSISIDVKQRVVYSNTLKTYGDRTFNVICAEPSPDALTVLGVSGGLSISDANSGKTTNAASALAESGGSIGLRTQSIQLLRDAMYRLCEGYANGAITNAEFEQMQRRFQSTMMGLIAIEQLTGPVVAGQVLLATNSGSQAGAGSGDAAVKSGQDDVKTAKDNELSAQANLDTANGNYTKAHNDVVDNQRQIATENAKKPPDQGALKNLNDATPGLVDKQATAENARKDAERRAKAASDEVKAAQARLVAAQSRASSSASGGGSIEAVSRAAAQMQSDLSQAVPAIVTSITLAYEREECLDLIRTTINLQSVKLTTPSATPSSASLDSATDAALKTCVAIVETAKTESDLAQQKLSNAKAQGQILEHQVQQIEKAGPPPPNQPK